MMIHLAKISVHQRFASTYVVVLGATMLITVAGLSALLVVRGDRRGQEMASDFTEARFLAQSAIEMGQLDIRRDANWRSTKSSGTWRANQALGRGSYSLTVTDADGNLGDDSSDSITMTGTGTVGSASFKLAVDLHPEEPAGMDSLGSAVHTATLLSVTSDLTVVDAPASSNGTVVVLGGTIDGNVEAVATITVTGTVKGTTKERVAAKQMPASTVFNDYIATGVSIPYGSLSGSTLKKVVLSPGSNPFGAVHPDGLYVISCANQKLIIKDLRVHGSLVILDPGTGSKIEGTVNWETFNPRMPALLVRGSIDFSWTGEVDEGSLNVNLNPPGSPYKGVANITQSDKYPGSLVGLVYVSGTLSISKPAEIQGVLISAGVSMDVNRPVTVTHDPSIILDPPKGFERPNRPMIPTPGTWRQVVN